MNQSGMSLVAVVVAIGLAGILAVGISQVVTNGVSGMQSVQQNQDLETLKVTIRDRLDCNATFNVTPTTTIPVACPANIVLKRRNNTPITTGNKLGVWTVKASCKDGALQVGATKKGKDPLTGKSWDAADSAVDLFKGTSDFCRELLDASYSTCSGTYDVSMGSTGGVPRCCRRISNGPIAVAGVLNHSLSYCAATEVVVAGGGGCNIPNPKPFEEIGFVQNFGIDMANNAYYVDCHGKSMVNPKDSPARSWAICCPKAG